MIDRGVRIPEGLVVGEDPELDAKRFRRTDKGICLITQPMIDRPGGLSAHARPLGRLRGLPADQDRRARRRRRRAAAGLWRRAASRCARCCRATPRCWRARRDRASSALSERCSAARRGCSPPARAAGLELIVLDAPHLYDRPGGPYLGADGADWPDNWRRFAALGRVAADIASGASAVRPDLVHATTGRPASRRPTCATTPAARPCHRDDHPQPRLPGPVSRRAARRARAAAAGLRARRRRVLRRRRLPEGRAALRRPPSPRSARPTPRRSRPRPTAWGSTA